MFPTCRGRGKDWVRLFDLNFLLKKKMIKNKFLTILAMVFCISITQINLIAQINLTVNQPNLTNEQLLDSTQISSVDTIKNEEISVATAAVFSTFVPGAGLYLTEDYLPATLYMFFGIGTYAATFAILGSSNEVHIDDGGAIIFLVTAGLIHCVSIIHTILAAIDYNEKITPLVTYGGKNIQFGLSIKI